MQQCDYGFFVFYSLHLLLRVRYNMALDLQLFSISNKENFVLEKAKLDIDYAIDFDKILNTETLQLHLKMIQENPDGTSEFALKELIEDSVKVVNSYPDKNIAKYTFYSNTRGYATLGYLLKQYLKDRFKLETFEIFYKGIAIECKSQWVRFEYLDSIKTTEISDLLDKIEFEELLKYYDYKLMSEDVYKLTNPEKFNLLEEEFNLLREFYKNAKDLNSFVIIKIS